MPGASGTKLPADVREVVDASARRGDVPVDERHRHQVLVVDRVLRREVVVAHHFLGAGEAGAGGEVVELPHQPGHPGEARLGVRVRLPGDVTVQIGQDLAAPLVDAEEPRRARPADPFEMGQQALGERRVCRPRPPDGVADSHDGVDEAARQFLLCAHRREFIPVSP
jgi:hypothetical protein